MDSTDYLGSSTDFSDSEPLANSDDLDDLDSSDDLDDLDSLAGSDDYGPNGVRGMLTSC